MKKLLLLLIAAIPCVGGFAQSKPIIEVEKWESNPKVHVLDPKYKEESAVILFDGRRVEYIDDATGDVLQYKTLHRIIHVLDDKGIESFNRIYLPVSDNGDIIDIKARTILPNGKIIELDRNNIKDLQEDEHMYKIFAMEGLVKGCEIEYFYTYKKDGGYFGREVIQGRVPVKLAKFSIVCPERLLFETRIFNAKAKQIDTVLATKRFIELSLDDIDGAEEEKYSMYTANLGRIEFKLSYNANRNKTERLFTWNELAKRVHSSYSTFSEKELKKTEDLIKSNGWAKLPGDKEKIVAIENYVKKTIGTREDISGEDAENVEKILKNKIASYRGVTRLYSAVFSKLGIDIQHVLTGDRAEFTLDKVFENWNNCENSLIYFSATKKFLSPASAEMRYPWIQPSWGNTTGLYCKGTTIGNFTTAIAEVKPIQLEDYSHSSNDIEAKVKLNPGADTLLVDITQSYRGYSASVYRAIFNFTSGEQQKNYLKEIVKFGTNSENIVSSKMENQDFESYSDNKPFTLNAVVKASELVEKAGSKILVKIGDIIGPQVEMYQEKQRKFPMEIQYPHTLGRKIEFVIPDGYVVKNLNELNINNVYKDNGQLTMGFTSGYTQEGNVVKINIMEEYRNTVYPIQQYEEFRKIINAAADFNKIVLVLEKSGK